MDKLAVSERLFNLLPAEVNEKEAELRRQQERYLEYLKDGKNRAPFALGMPVAIMIGTSTALMGMILPSAIMIIIGLMFRNQKKAWDKKYKGLSHERRLPFQLVANSSWNDIMDALVNGEKIAHRASEERNMLWAYDLGIEDHKYVQLIDKYPIMEALGTLKRKLFDTNAMDEVNTTKNRKDMENSVLWNNRLLRKEMINRMSLLLSITTEGEREAFLNQPEEDIAEFYRPIQEFYDYVEKVSYDEEFRREELNKFNISTHNTMLENNMNLRLNIALDKQNEVKKDVGEETNQS